MFKEFKKEIDFGGKKITLETGKVARQADGAIIATCGETVVLATAVGAKKVCLLYTSPSPRDKRQSRMPSSA